MTATANYLLQVGRRFVAKGTTVRAGRKQVFARAELFADNEEGARTLVATGETP
jgi:acyl-coenzyme A thioesterase PaaI-like protein